jgi:tripartite-type tricarboxylate transporter receptor subunit TctC
MKREEFEMGTINVTRRTLLAGGSLALAGVGTAGIALGQQAAGKTIQFILPVAVASGVDTITRSAQNELSKALGATVVVNNQPGAGGLIGTQQLVKSAPDGLTLSIVSNNHVIYPSVLKSVPFDPIADITPIAVLGTTPLVLVVNPKKIPAKNVQELVALLKAKPDGYNYGSSGNGTILHLAAAMFVEQAGVKVTHVPYKGVGPLLTDLIGEHVDWAVLAYPSIASHVQSGALRAIGVGTPQRIAVAPEMPTVAEQGMPNFVVEGWFAVIGPAKLPPADVARIHAAFTAAFNSAEVKAAMAKQATTINILAADKTAAYMKSELEKYAAISKKIGLEPQ